jgi:hypothetical protein
VEVVASNIAAQIAVQAARGRPEIETASCVLLPWVERAGLANAPDVPADGSTANVSTVVSTVRRL